MMRWSVRRMLVGVVAIAVSITARSADAQSFGAPPQRDIALVSAPMPVMVRPPPPDWRAVPTNASHWRGYLAQQRSMQIARLRMYAQAGQFPENRVQPGRLNVFVDGNGRLCAVANLMAQSGHRALVDRVTSSNNFLRFADVSSGPLADWALSSGLTREEIVRIQEPYEYIPPNLAPSSEWQAQQAERSRLQNHFAVVVRELEINTPNSLSFAVSRLGHHLNEAPHDLAWDAPQPVVQPVVYPQPVVQPVIYPTPYAQQVVVYPEPVRRPVRVNPYAQPVVFPTAQPVFVTPVPVEPVMIPVEPTPVQVVPVVGPLQVQVHVSVRANPQVVTY